MTAPDPTAAHSPTAGAAELAGVLEAYLAELQAGRPADRAAVLAAHPHLAAQLDSCLAALEFIHHTGGTGVPVRLGDFQIVREIGRGGMGVVYEAEQRSLRRRVALKVLRYGGPADPEALARFRREAELVARLHHTNIVPIFAFGCENGVHYYAMQLIDGHSLAATAAPREPLEVARWGLQAAEALAYAHARGIVHRDVKPSNLLLDGEGTVWLSDFGLARPAEETALTAAGVPLGTPRYMSPEQVAAQPVDGRTDVYSLGATLYELATGRPVFDADGVPQLLARIRDEEPAPPRQVRPDVPRDLETVILKCLHKEPERRYESAQALADDLRAFREGRAIKARRVGLLVRAGRWVGRQRLGPGAVAWVVTIVVLPLIWCFLLLQDLREIPTIPLTIAEHPGRLAGGAFQAELLHRTRDERLAPLVGVPMLSSVSVPVGRHRLRVSRPGWLSADYELDIPANSASFPLTVQLVGVSQGQFHPQGFAIPVAGPNHGRWQPIPFQVVQSSRHAKIWPRPHLWQQPPQPNLWGGMKSLPPPPGLPDDTALVGFVPVGRGHDLIALALRRDAAARLKDGPWLVRRVQGTTGAQFWETALPLMRMSYVLLAPELVVVGDRLILADGFSPTLACLDAGTGKQRWSFRGGSATPPADPWPRGAGTVGRPLACTVPGRSAPVLVARALPAHDAAPEVWGVDADTGGRLWRSSLPAPAVPARRPFHAQPALTRARVRGKDVVVWLEGDRLIGLDPATGRDAWPRRVLPFVPEHPPRFTDLDGDGDTDLLVLHASTKGTLTLMALSLRTGAVLWEETWAGQPQPADPKDSSWSGREPDWPLVADLGPAPAVVVLRSDQPGNALDLVALDGRTGRPRWQRRLGRGRLAWLRMLAGPDLDDDGVPDLLAVTSFTRWMPGAVEETELYVDALSGQTGAPLWVCRRSVRRPDGGPAILIRCPPAPCLWPTGDGGTLLAVPLLDPSPFGQTLVLDLQGRLRHVIAGMSRADAVDVDGDGRAELLGPVGDAHRTENSHPWSVIAGWAPGLVPVESVEADEDDPRRLVPLPWARNEFLSMMHYQNISVWRPTLQFMIPVVLIGALLGACVNWWKRRRIGSSSDPDKRDRGRRLQRLCLLLLVLGYLTTTAVGLAWTWLARGELAPGEEYHWGNWFGMLVTVGYAVGVAYLVLVQMLRSLLHLARRWRTASA